MSRLWGRGVRKDNTLTQKHGTETHAIGGSNIAIRFLSEI